MTRFLLGLMICIGLASTSDAQLIRRRPVEQPKVSAPPVVVAAADEGKVGGVLTEDHRTIYETARDRAVAKLARKKNISRAEAREMIDDAATDETLHKMASKAGIKFKAMPVTGKFTDFIQWIIDHQDAIMKLVQIILALFGVDHETAVEMAIAIAWDHYTSQ